jgi:predicted extracellular nuclease
MDAEIVGLMVIENDGFGAESAIVELVDGINTEMGEGTYAVVDAGGSGDDDKGTSKSTVTLLVLHKRSQLSSVTVWYNTSIDRW